MKYNLLSRVSLVFKYLEKELPTVAVGILLDGSKRFELRWKSEGCRNDAGHGFTCTD
jgi:hypothetical protein